LVHRVPSKKKRILNSHTSSWCYLSVIYIPDGGIQHPGGSNLEGKNRDGHRSGLTFANPESRILYGYSNWFFVKEHANIHNIGTHINVHEINQEAMTKAILFTWFFLHTCE
jgi:hypothetical protein